MSSKRCGSRADCCAHSRRWRSRCASCSPPSAISSRRLSGNCRRASRRCRPRCRLRSNPRLQHSRPRRPGPQPHRLLPNRRFRTRCRLRRPLRRPLLRHHLRRPRLFRQHLHRRHHPRHRPHLLRALKRSRALSLRGLSPHARTWRGRKRSAPRPRPYATSSPRRFAVTRARPHRQLHPHRPPRRRLLLRPQRRSSPHLR
jgi:hypothetical protein